MRLVALWLSACFIIAMPWGAAAQPAAVTCDMTATVLPGTASSPDNYNQDFGRPFGQIGNPAPFNVTTQSPPPPSIP